MDTYMERVRAYNRGISGQVKRRALEQKEGRRGRQVLASLKGKGEKQSSRMTGEQ